MRNAPLRLICFLAALAAAGCGGSSGGGGGQGTAQDSAFIVATDFETGSFATVSLDEPHQVTPASAERRIHSDAVARTYDGLVYVINRFLGDNIQVLDPAMDFATRIQCSTGGGSNPQDIAFVSRNKAYVTLYDLPELLIVDPSPADDCSDFVRGSIDLSAVADADGIPEMGQMAIVNDLLYVALQHLDRDSGFVPSGPGGVVVIDTATDEIIEEISLTGGNPFGSTKGLTVKDDMLVIAEAGTFGVNDGGIERVDPQTRRAGGFVVTEEELGGDITDFVPVSETRWYAIVSHLDFTNSLIAFDPTTGTVTGRPIDKGGFLADVELNDRGELFVADRTFDNPGIRIFRAADGEELTGEPLDVVLPPFDIVFLE